MFRQKRSLLAAAALLAGGVLCPVLMGQQVAKPLTNSDIVRMVKGGVPESVIVSSIQSRPANFDLSPDALIRLHRLGVTKRVMDAMMAAGGTQAAPTAAPPAEPPPAPPTVADPPTTAPPTASPPSSPDPSPSQPGFQLPEVAAQNPQGGMPMELPLEKTQLVETKTKPTSLASLAGDSVMTQVIQTGVNQTATGVATHMNSRIAGSSVQGASTILNSALAHRKPTVTYVWGVPNPASSNVLETDTPVVLVDFGHVPGVNPSDFEPAIVKLTPAQNACRIVGATEGKEDARTSDVADWKIYSSFLEERVRVNSQKNAPGLYRLSPASPLFPGEYAVVLRPVSKSKRFSGGDVARAQGDGFIFDAAWSFGVPLRAKSQ